MNNSSIGALSLAMVCSTAYAQTDKSSDERQLPNVIFIYADDLGYGDLECYGAHNVSTPNVNRLADNGIRFTNGYASSSTSTPSRYSLLTGEYAWRRKDTGIARGDAGMIIRPGQYTMADMFKSAGYATAAFGKWHLGLGTETGKQDWNAPLPAALGDLGFDYSYIMAATADRVPCVFIENGQVANYDLSDPIYVSYEENFPGEPTGKDNPELLYNLKPSHGHDQSIVNGISRIGYMKGGGKALWKDENIADSITEHAVRYLRQHRNERFFMYFATNDIHVPRFPHERFRGKNKMGLRGEAIMQFDWSVGRILQTLDELGLTDNTLIILSSDNGPVVDDGYQDRAVELLNGHRPAGDLRGGKYSTFEGGTRVPVIVHWPNGISKPQVSDILISQIDWLASLAALTGARIPRGCAFDSYDRLGNLIGTDTIDRPWVIEHAANNTLSVRTPEWKYIEANDDSRAILKNTNTELGNAPIPQLYDMTVAGERENVAAKHPEVVFELQQILRQVRNRTIKMK